MRASYKPLAQVPERYCRINGANAYMENTFNAANIFAPE